MSSVLGLIRRSPRHVVVAAVVLAVAAPAALAASGSKPPQLVPPKLLSPATGAHFRAGTHIDFKVRTFPHDTYLWLHISHSAKRTFKPAGVGRPCGVIQHDVHIYSLDPTKSPSVYRTHTTLYTFPGFWMATPGTYYWQAWRIENHFNADGCIESPVRKLVITR